MLIISWHVGIATAYTCTNPQFPFEFQIVAQFPFEFQIARSNRDQNKSSRSFRRAVRRKEQQLRRKLRDRATYRH